MAHDEILAIYDRLTLLRTLQQYHEDGLYFSSFKDISKKFARGLTTFLDIRFQNFKFQLWDSREYFKPTYDFDDTAIVIQGPIVYENNYTVETFKLYRSIYPNAPIVVSTWKDEATNAFREECKEHLIILLENEPPKDRGLSNVNLQIKSSYQGVKYIQENTNAKFVLKTRTDQRINRFDFLVYFKNLLETFPPYEDKLKQRIIFLSSLATKTMPFFFYDFLSFGHLSDISKLYNIPFYRNSGEMTYSQNHRYRLNKVQKILRDYRCPFDYNSITESNRKIRNLNRMMRRFYNPEIYLMRTFYNTYVEPIDETKLIETSWKFTRDYLILIDWNLILFDWPKYEDRNSYEANAYTGGRTDFSRWLDMYRNFKIDWV